MAETKTKTALMAALSVAAIPCYIIMITMLIAFSVMDAGSHKARPATRPAQTDITATAPAALPENNQAALISLGTFKISHYCPCKKCSPIGVTKSGTIPTPGRTISVDPAVIPLGSTVMIDGREYIAEDTGGGIRDQEIDMFVSSHQEALNLGVRKTKVYMKGNDE